MYVGCCGQERSTPRAEDCICPTSSLEPRSRDPLGYARQIPAGGLPKLPRRPIPPSCDKSATRSYVTYQCSRHLLLPPPQLPPPGRSAWLPSSSGWGAAGPSSWLPSARGVNVLLATSDHFGHGVFALVQRVINQIHLARRNGLEPAVFIGERTFMEPQACESGVNPYHHAPAGDNVWEYWFVQPGNFSFDSTTVRGWPIASLQVTTVEASAEFPVRSYGPLEMRGRSRRAANTILGDGGWKLVKASIREEADLVFAKWRRRSRHVLGVHLRGTDKVVRAKVPPEAHFPFIDAYLRAYRSDALVFVATDDRRYMRRLGARYGYSDADAGADAGGGRSGRLVSRGSGYEDASWGGNADLASERKRWLRAPHAPSSSSGYDKGLQVLLDALLLSKCDYVLISASAVSEFALWVRPHLWGHHLDLQSVNRFKGQTMPPWTRHIPGASKVGRLRRHSFVAEVFCAALAAACLNETRHMYRGRHCNKCERQKPEEQEVAA